MTWMKGTEFLAIAKSPAPNNIYVIGYESC